ncbi:glycosyltransferase [Mucilaginibacter sp. SP1R1]|uniref:glycosyltransferase n=1 Tax=Mucilaginibacter sp. SP1R1 TaxID=2723091 RepID=UPI00162184F5|nr:glycosyltransferase [Mucilaginibacter sp. SP1R1]MBB6151135.1 glycosyltransferase involved in cell wall biosynthesis [Mucilaginibacter sp. SP1R1]
MKTISALPQKPRLFFVIPSLKGGGAERVLIALANHFNQLNCAPVIIALNYAEPAYVIDEGVRVIYLVDRRQNQIWHRIYYILLTFFKLLGLFLKERPVCVLSFITSANIWSGMVGSITGTPYIVSERTSPNRSIFKLNQFFKYMVALLYKKATAIVVGSQGVEDCLREHDTLKDVNNIYKITNAVPAFKPVSSAPVHHRKFILGVGRLEYVKGFDLLVTAFSNAKTDDTDLLIVGDGQERENLTRQINELGLTNRVVLVGTKNNLQDYYSQAEIFVLPSRNEGYPNALVEAMSFGCPCIAMDCEFGPSEIIVDKYNGLLVPIGETAILSAVMGRLAHDQELKLRLSRHAHEINYTNSTEQIFHKWEGLLLRHVEKAAVYSSETAQEIIKVH